jgi:hypothetical protein
MRARREVVLLPRGKVLLKIFAIFRGSGAILQFQVQRILFILLAAETTHMNPVTTSQLATLRDKERRETQISYFALSRWTSIN